MLARHTSFAREREHQGDSARRIFQSRRYQRAKQGRDGTLLDLRLPLALLSQVPQRELQL